MNKYEEALDVLVEIYKENDEYVHHLHDLKELIDKATPKKAVHKVTSYFCPVCGNWSIWDDALTFEGHQYCPKCGQRLEY